MARLWELLGIEKGLTAVMGSGGKTSLLYELAEELRQRGTVLLATTTHITLGAMRRSISSSSAGFVI